ncbi:transcriptional regulator [Lactiplantibacillus garii]|uniref:Transcriptional regulator n=1 Tax=Lactiplantibacillus garii TaxID=2306423 RepID=A0A426D6Z5_9LACO|nr:metalloregulator ArsR/SmtB family transcription factor [Lactiplantibacillus garii]RRK10219.1 transcriptional regulator [Lactiplantibacillus garii]
MSEETLALFKTGIPIFTMLTDENRQKILVMLCQVDKMSVSEITEKLALSRPAVSHHLSLLLNAGLLKVTKIGTERYYSNSMGATLTLLKRLTNSLEADIAEHNR